MKVFSGIAGCLLAVGFMTSCSSNENNPVVPEEYGYIKLGVSAGTDFNASRSRAVDESLYSNVNNYKLVITKDGELFREFASVADVPSTLELLNGSYAVTASYGTEHPKSRTEFYSGDTEVLTVQGNTQDVRLVCEPTCAKVRVNFDPSMATYFTDYSVDFSTKALGSDKALWNKADQEPWYLLVAPEGEEVKATISLNAKPEYQIPSGKVTKTYNLRPNKGWALNIKPNYSSSDGMLGLTITIDEGTDDTIVDIVVPSDWITDDKLN